MKYIKKYESLKKPKYKVGDYVLLNNSYHPYYVQHSELNTCVAENEIKRKLSPEEIEEYKIKMNSQKYKL